MSKVQNSKRSRKNKKSAKYAKLKTNTAHPSHLSADNTKAIRNYWEKLYGGEKLKGGNNE